MFNRGRIEDEFNSHRIVSVYEELMINMMSLDDIYMNWIITMKENLKDQESVEKSFFKSVWERNLADDRYEIGVLNEADGGTLYDDYRDIFEYFGIKSKAYFITTKSDEFV